MTANHVLRGKTRGASQVSSRSGQGQKEETYMTRGKGRGKKDDVNHE